MTETKRVLDIDLERYLLGELPGERAAAISAAIQTDPGVAARIAAIEADNEAILNAYPPRPMTCRIEERFRHDQEGRAEPGSRYRWPVVAAATAAAAALAMLLVPMGGLERAGDPTPSVADNGLDGVRLKGTGAKTPALFVYRHRETHGERLRSGQVAAEGDLIQIKYAAKGYPHGMIFSVDGRGTVTLHYPSSEAGATALEKGTVALDDAYELDDAPEFERFFFVASDAPIDVARVLERGRRVGASGSLTLTPELRVSEFMLRKR